MANLADIVSRKQSRDEEWKAQRQADRDNAVAMQDTAVSQIAQRRRPTPPTWNCQGDNLMYSVGNIALALFQKPEVTRFGTAERWKSLGRTVLESEKPKGFQIFARSSLAEGTSSPTPTTSPRPRAGRRPKLKSAPAPRRWRKPWRRCSITPPLRWCWTRTWTFPHFTTRTVWSWP